MKKMKTTIAATVALAACAGTQLFAQNKEDVITFALTGLKQVSVSTSATADNAGNWSQQPHFYKSNARALSKITDKDIIKFIAAIKHDNANYYSSKAQLVMVQGELSGFFSITRDLAESYPHNHYLDGTTTGAGIDGFFYTQDFDASTDLRNSSDSTFVTMDNGHHFEINNTDQSGLQPSGTELYPVGHLQPWGQIFVKDIAGRGTATSPLCENVTYYFAMSVEECYDCFYMNSFVSDASFKTITSSAAGQPPCCTTESSLVGKGTDRYYLTLSFDNTENNPYLNDHSDIWVGDYGYGANTVHPGQLPGDGVVPDQYNVSSTGTEAGEGDYHDLIKFRRANFLPYEARFTLNGILTYAWDLKFVSAQDIAPDFVGIGKYPVTGYGFIGLYCQLLNGSVTFTEKVVKTACCLDQPWDEDWYGPGAEYVITQGEGGNVLYTTYWQTKAWPDDSPYNVGASLTYHHNFDMNYPWAQLNWGAGWPSESVIRPLGLQGPDQAWGAVYGAAQP